MRLFLILAVLAVAACGREPTGPRSCDVNSPSFVRADTLYYPTGKIAAIAYWCK